MEKTRKDELDNYLIQENVALGTRFGESGFLNNLFKLGDEEKEELFNKVEELKKHGCLEPLLWAIQDVDKSEDLGGTAYFLFIREMLQKSQDVNSTLSNIDFANKPEYWELIQTSNSLYGERFQNFLIEYSYNLMIRLLSVIEPDRSSLSKSHLRSWRLVATDNNGRIQANIEDLNKFTDYNDFDI